MIQKIIDWLPRSSADATRVSLSVKGALTAIIPVTVLGAQLAGITEVDSVVVQELVDTAEEVVFTLSLAVSALMTGYGVVRRILNKSKK